MATSNAFSTDNEYIKYTISITQNSQSVENNTSNVNVSVRFYRTNTGYETYGTGTLYVKVNGVIYSSPVTSSQKITNSGIVLFNRNFEISHKSDGTKTLTTSAWINHSRFTSTEQSYSQVLTTIPRATTPTLSVTSANMGDSITIETNRASTNFTHTLSYSFGGSTGTIANNVATSTSWAIPLDLASQIPNETSGVCTITCKTYNGSTLIGNKNVTIKLKVPSSVKPTINNISITEAVSAIASKFNAYVQTKSKLNVVTTSTGALSSTIKNYKVEIFDSNNNSLGVYSGSSITTDFITKSGTIKVSVSVTDSRGRSTTLDTNITVVEYKIPKISKFTAYRCNEDGTENYEGQHLKIALNFSVSSVNNFNDKYYEVVYRVKGSSTWSAIESSTSLYSANKEIITSAIFNVDNEYDVALNVYDYFTSAFATLDIPTAFTLIDFNASGKGIAFGKVSQKDCMEIAMDVDLTGKLLQEDFKQITLSNNWVNYGGEYQTACYWKDKNNVVHLHGLIKGGATTFNTNIFNLPEGYRPSAREIFLVATNDGVATIYILPSGNVNIGSGGNATFTSLSGISFKAI